MNSEAPHEPAARARPLSRRRALTMVEMIVVGIVLMAFLGTITQLLIRMPTWLSGLEDRMDLLREELLARAFLLKDARAAWVCSSDGIARLSMEAANGSGIVTYSVAPVSEPAGLFELRRTPDGGLTSMRVAAFVSSFRVTPRATPGDFDVCLVFNKRRAYRRSQFQVWNIPTTGLALADLDRDGILDLVQINSDSTSIRRYRGTGAGTFNAPTSILGSGLPVDVRLADMDRNGTSDLVVLAAARIPGGADGGLYVFPGDGAGSFAAPVRSAVASSPGALAIGDVNRDGRPDVVVTDALSRTVSFLAGNGTASFPSRTERALGFTPTGIQLADMNRDGTLDLVVGQVGDSAATVSVVPGNGDGTFGARTGYQAGVASTALAVGDLDRDGRQDVATVSRADGMLYLMLGLAGGALAPAAATGTAVPSSVAIGRSDAGDVPDVAVVNSLEGGASSTFSWFPGTGDGTLQPPAVMGLGTRGQAVVGGDLNRDSRVDWVTGSLALTPGYAAQLATTVNVSGTLSAATAFSAGTGPVALRSADFNRDGFPDLATVNQSNTARVYTGSAAGTFSLAGSFATGVGSFAMRVADINRDGILDLVVLNSADKTVSVLRGQGDGTFLVKIDSTTGQTPVALAVGDFDRNGFDDLAIVTQNATGTTVYLGDGSGSFPTGTSATPPAPAQSDPTAVEAMDVNRDGLLDLVTPDAGTKSVTVTFGTPSGGFGTSVGTAIGQKMGALAVGDFNRDGKPDCALVHDVSDSLTVWLGDGVGGFSGGLAYATSKAIRKLTAADMNRDGIPDLIGVSDFASGGAVDILRGVGDGTFQAKASYGYAAPVGPADVVVFEVNRDGKPDVATANTGDSTVSYRTGQ